MRCIRPSTLYKLRNQGSEKFSEFPKTHSQSTAKEWQGPRASDCMSQISPLPTGVPSPLQMKKSHTATGNNSNSNKNTNGIWSMPDPAWKALHILNHLILNRMPKFRNYVILILGMRSEGSERLSNLPKVTQLVSMRPASFLTWNHLHRTAQHVGKTQVIFFNPLCDYKHICR